MEQLTQFNMFKLLKKVQTAYFFSILLFSSSLVFLILHSMKSYSIISIFSVMKFSIDRNHVFLICNGILVFIVKSSSSSSSSSQDSNSCDYSSNAVQNDQCLPRPVSLSDQKKQEEFSALSSEQKVVTDVKASHFSTIEEDNVHVHIHQKVVSECQVHAHDDDHDHNHEELDDDDDDDDHDHDHEEDDDHEYEEGAEELNKRCEDFIRRMKQGIISESKKDMGLTRFS